MLTENTVLQGRFRIICQIGKGGMGTVYVAKDENLGVTVAVKQNFYDDPRLIEAFKREARLLASLRHSALPQVKDYFLDPTGQYLVMEYIEGDDFETILNKRRQMIAPAGEPKPFDVNDVIHWTEQLLDTLDYLHTRSEPVIHRDIKPQNLKLAERNQIILLDFGLAKGKPLWMTRVTTTGSIYGYTPNYAPLEQIRGLGTDPRSDLYALGATVYHLITGAPPVDAATRADAFIGGEPDPLRAANEVNPNVPREIAAMLVKAMEQHRNKRPSSAAEMLEMLRAAKHSMAIDRQAQQEQTRLAETSRQEESTWLASEVQTHNLADEQTEIMGAVQQEERERQAREEAERKRQQQDQARKAAEEAARLRQQQEAEALRQREAAEAFRLQQELERQAVEEARRKRQVREQERKAQEEAERLKQQAEREQKAREATATLGSQETLQWKRAEQERIEAEQRKKKMLIALGIILSLIVAVILANSRHTSGSGAVLFVLIILVVVVILIKSKRPQASSQTMPLQADLGAGALSALMNSFVQIPAGEFVMGSDTGNDDEKPVHYVRIIQSFQMSKCVVTQAQWEAMMGSNPSQFKSANLPVENVSWDDVQQFINRLNARNDGYVYRLPTEAEWEYACRAGSRGDYAGNLDAMAWYEKTSGGRTHPVGQRLPNVWGLSDMHGNVWEWVQDWYDERYYAQGAGVDPPGPGSGSYRVLRGGSCGNAASFCRSAARSKYAPDGRNSFVGFRLVRTWH